MTSAKLNKLKELELALANGHPLEVLIDGYWRDLHADYILRHPLDLVRVKPRGIEIRYYTYAETVNPRFTDDKIWTVSRGSFRYENLKANPRIRWLSNWMPLPKEVADRLEEHSSAVTF